MAKNQYVTEEITKALGEHLKTKMCSLKQVLLDWPHPNRNLSFPSLTISTGTPIFSPSGTIYELSREEITATKSTVNYIVGDYEWELQLDFWCRDKAQRHRIYDEFFRAMHDQLPKTGIALNVVDYFGVYCHYVHTGLDFSDSEEASQRREWRLRVPVVADTKAIMPKEEFIILQTELDLEVSETIVIEE